MSPYTFSSIIHCTDGHIAGLASKLFFAEEFEESLLASVVGLSRSDSIQLGHDPIDSIRFTIHSFRPIRLKFLTQSAI